MQLSQVRAIITGGASGLGHAVEQYFVVSGGKVALIAAVRGAKEFPQ